MTPLGDLSTELVAHATLDGEGRLLAADPALFALHRRAGGDIGMPLLVPPIAAIIRLARRLGVPVSRGVVVADDDNDLELWVRAVPGNGGVSLAVSGWRERPLWAPLDLAGDARADWQRAGADWSWETDAALRLTRVSIEAGRRHGFDPLFVLGEPVTALFALDEPGAAAFARREPIMGMAAKLRGADADVELSAIVRRDPAGRFAGFLGATRVVEALADPPSGALPESFTAGLDQALRRPLAQIIANADSIRAATDGPLQQHYADYAADIAGAGRHLLALVDDLVDLQAVEQPGFALTTEAIDLADLCRRAAGLLALRARDAAVVIERPAAEAALTARGDYRRVLQILVNLVSNAVRYAPRGSIVLIDAHIDGGVASATVRDEGKGIAPADQARIFEKFERVDTGEPGGSGLGLYIARRLARAMGGDLAVASAPDEGAVFTLTLPAAPQPPRGEDERQPERG